MKQATPQAPLKSPSAPKKRWQAFGALRHPHFRTFWFSLIAYVSAVQILQIVLAWAIYDMTNSAIYLGLFGGAMSIPAIAVTFFGGVIADRLDRRQILLIAVVVHAINIGTVALISFLGLLAPWHLLLSSAFLAGVMGMEGPSRQAIIPNLIDRQELMNAIALFSAVWQGTRIVGPFLGGIFIEAFGLTTSLTVVASMFLLSTFLLAFVRADQVKTQGEAFLTQMVDGLAFIRKSPLFYNLIGMTFFNSFFGMSYIFLLPIFAADILNMGAAGLGLLMGASALGSLTGTLVIAAFGKDRQRNTFLVGGAVLFGATLIVFAYAYLVPFSSPLSDVVLFGVPMTTAVLLTVIVLPISGAANSAYMITIMTVLQAAVPDELRGRVMGIHGLTWSLMPLGGLQGGFVANFFGAPFAVAVGGAAVIGYSLLAVARPSFRRRVDDATTPNPVSG